MEGQGGGEAQGVADPSKKYVLEMVNPYLIIHHGSAGRLCL
jgi:hypothetical protein